MFALTVSALFGHGKWKSNPSFSGSRQCVPKGVLCRRQLSKDRGEQ
jgi:hypothetical protein